MDYQKKKDHIRFNPVAAELVEGPQLCAYGSASNKFTLDPIPQGQKLLNIPNVKAGPKGLTLGAVTRTSGTAGEAAKA